MFKERRDIVKFTYRGLDIEYEIVGTGEPIILLHGWGTSKDTFSSITQILKEKYEVHLIDLIGFGNSSEPFKPLNLNEYVLFLRYYIEKNNITNPIILGHSFGGRIAIVYTALYKDTKKLILVDSAGIKRRFNLKVWYKVRLYKIKKWWYKITFNYKAYNKLITTSGSNDYKNASLVMKATLSNVVKNDLRKYLKMINIETLIIWGKDDKVTPYNDALIMNRLLKNSGLVTFENTGHFPYLENKKQFNIVIKEYLQVNR